MQAYEDATPIALFSKLYRQSGNPMSQYAAMMCCSEVDADCPIIQGSDVRIPLHYQDPKTADGTSHENATYDERCLQIGRDMFELMWMTRRLV